MILKTEAIVLKSFDFRETSRIATFFTKEYGKVKGVMKGIRKDSRKFGSHVDKFSVNDIVYYQYRRSDLHLISQCDLKQFFFPVREDYRRTVAAHYALELVDTIMPSEEPNAKIYQLLLDYLKGLGSFPDIDRLVHILQIKILLLSGFRPYIDACVKCGKKVEGKAYFSLKAGGLVCGRCPARESSLTAISQGTVATMLHIEASPWEKGLRLGLTKTVRKELKYILNKFLVYHLERKIKTAAYL
ncbi:MAG: DNA repair protein RecO [Candidatus Omnitrophica bacterium]|nr:DNA repair protein RecO [Candidatus Omnitrophota bacterium]